MAKYEKTIIGRFEEVVNRLQNDIGNSGITMNLVDESNYTSRDTGRHFGITSINSFFHV